MKVRVTSALFAFLTLASGLANAQMSEGEKKAAARAAYTEGVALQDKGNPAEALARFEAAEKLFDAPTHLLHIAECQALTGKLVEASETYETLIRKPLGKDAPDAFVQAQEQGKAELTQLRQRIPTMRVVVKPDPQSLQNLQITVNDKQMPAELAGIARPVNPGPYKLTASATGWGTPAPVEVEVKEKEPKTVELSLQQGVNPGVAAVGPTPLPAAGSTGETPPPYEQAKPKPAGKESPSSLGLLLGVRPGFFVPAGDIDKNTKFETVATAGAGIGFDVIGRVGRIFLVGGTLEYASLGAPGSENFPVGARAEVATSATYAGVLVGIMPNVDRVTFVADADLGMRFLSSTQTITLPGQTAAKTEASYSGLEAGLNAGFSIPAGPIRIVPKAGFALGQFTSRDCGLGATTAGATSALGGCGGSDFSAYHTILNVVVGLYYHHDVAKKSASASSSPVFSTASR